MDQKNIQNYIVFINKSRTAWSTYVILSSSGNLPYDTYIVLQKSVDNFRIREQNMLIFG